MQEKIIKVFMENESIELNNTDIVVIAFIGKVGDKLQCRISDGSLIRDLIGNNKKITSIRTQEKEYKVEDYFLSNEKNTEIICNIEEIDSSDPKEIKTTVISLFGAPGTGKSTTASQLFYLMKTAGYDVELVSEFAKDLVWENRFHTMKNQIYIFGKQHHRLHRLKGQVRYIITDCPLLLSEFYNKEYNGGSTNFRNLVMEEVEKYDNLNIFLNRKKEYVAKGRTQNEEESDAIAVRFKDMLDETGYEYHTFDAYPNVGELIFELIKELEIEEPISTNDIKINEYDTSLTRIPKYCTLFTIEDFIEAVKDNCIMDDDGSGHLSLDGKYYFSKKEVCCHVDILEENMKSGFKYVVWFNK